jgi:purine-binding chemotaxis protein CheW
VTAFTHAPYASNRQRPWCCFRSGSRSFAVDLKAVVEVIETEGLVRLPFSPSGILGLCAFRRDVIPVVRLASQPEAVPSPRGRIDVLILRTEQGFWGLCIDRSGTVVTEDFLEEEPGLDPEASPGPAVLLGNLHRGEAVCSVIDPEATWQRIRAAVERDFRAPLAAHAGVSPATAAVAQTGTGGGS